MSPERSQRLRALFDEARSQEPDGRERMLRELAEAEPETAAELRRMLADRDPPESATQAATAPMSESMVLTIGSGATRSTMPIGSVFADRYQILQTLGAGGMGAVYKAFDTVAERLVALKVIRDELAERPDIKERFRREMVYARKIVHRNVIRIFDMGVAETARFITMEYIDGATLAQRLNAAGRLPAEEAVGIMLQVAQGLAAAHAEGVVHRDLKPENIMLDKQGRAAVMDFGIARGSEQTALTQTAQVMGTPAYMSPEQAKGETAGPASDIFTFGIILYQLLLGSLPYAAANPMASLLKRTKEAAPDLHEQDPAIPAELARIVAKCLAIAPEKRYGSVTELAADLETWDKPAMRRGPKGRKVNTARWVATGAIAAALGAGGGALLMRDRLRPDAPSAPKPLTMLVADFDNGTGDPELDGTVEPVLALAMEDASFITMYNRAQARNLVPQVKPGATRMDESTARLVAMREGVDVVLMGSIVRNGDGYEVKVSPIDSASGKQLETQKAGASRKRDLLGVIARLASPLRRLLGDKSAIKEEFAAETFTAASIESAHQYAKAQELGLLGRWDEAIQAYQDTIKMEPEMGRAHAGLAVIYRNLGRTDDAVRAYQEAMKHIDRMTERERYRTLGGYYMTIHNQQKAAEEYSRLVEKYPADTAGHANLALASLFLRDTNKALAEGRKAVQIYPKNIPQRNNVALYAMYGGDFETASREAKAVLELSPKFTRAFIALGIAELATGHEDAARQTYGRLEAVSPVGASMANLALADLALYEGRSADAASILEKGIAADREARPQNAAVKMAALAEILESQGKAAAATAMADRAVAAGSDENVLYPAAMVYLSAKQQGKATDIATKLESRLGQEPRVYAALIRGEAQRRAGKPQAAALAFQDAQKILDTWLVRFHLGRAYLEANAYAEAHSEFDRCLQRKGEATSLFLDEAPTYRYFSRVLYYQARAEEGLGSPGARDSYARFLALRQAADANDALTEDAKRRMAALATVK